MTDPNDVSVYDLSAFWEDSVGEPLSLFSNENPSVQTGTYVIRPGERVPETGATSHGAPEISIILTGEVILGLPTDDEERVVGPGTLVIIPAEVEHYSENRTDDDVELVYTVVGDL